MLTAYLLRLLPGLVVLAGLLVLLPKAATELRLFVYILAFVLARDVMTPIGLWTISSSMVLRFDRDPLAMLCLGAGSAALGGLILRLEPDLASLVVWWRGPRPLALAAGVGTALVAALPVHLGYAAVASPASALPLTELPALLVLALLGNFLEELLFRGCLQGLIERYTRPLRAAVISGVFFAACHTFLALSVTSIGWPILLFTVYEGIIAALVRTRFGLIASTLTHGGLIFLLASGRV
jgi:membrane protease YdiL (CAAX protease family)